MFIVTFIDFITYHLVYMRNYIYKIHLKEFLKLFNCLASSGIHTVFGWLDLLFKALHQERKRRKERIVTRLVREPRVVVILPLFIDFWYVVGLDMHPLQGGTVVSIRQDDGQEALHDGYYVAYKPITRPCVLFMFIEMTFIHC